METFQCHVAIDNALDRDLKVAEKRLDWGVFRKAPTNVRKMLREEAFVATGKPWLPGGAEGMVEYEIEGVPDVKLRISFDVPATAGRPNHVSADVIGAGYRATLKDFHGAGATESVTVKVEEL